MSQYGISIIKSKNGVQRDGTSYACPYYTQAQWCRVYEGAMRKMGGYKATIVGNDQIIRTLFAIPGDNQITVYVGRWNQVTKFILTRSGVPSSEIDITPATIPNLWNPGATETDTPYIWQFDSFTNVIVSMDGSVTQVVKIVALVTPNGNDSYSTTEGPLFQQDASSSAILEPILYETTITNVTASGGLRAIPPVMTVFGNGGMLRFSEANDCTKWPESSTGHSYFLVMANTKLLAAERTWSGNSQSLLIWSTNALIRANWSPITDTSTTPATVIPNFDYITIQDNVSLISPNSIAQYDQMFFWIGIDQFYMYNGIVNTLENSMNNDWFFENINNSYNARCWALSIPRYKEVWFLYPRNEPDTIATECNAAVIFNIEAKVWYDTGINRSCGIPAGVYPYPLMADTTPETLLINNVSHMFLPIWTHEFEYNKTIQNNEYAILSYFESHRQDMWTQNPAASNLIKYYRVAPDLRQNVGGVMTFRVRTQRFPNGPIEDWGPYPFIGGNLYTPVPNTSNPVQYVTNNTERVDIAVQGAITWFLFESNTLDGFYQEGKTLLFWKKGDTLN